MSAGWNMVGGARVKWKSQEREDMGDSTCRLIG
jgi:hypothetical protein